MTERMAVKLVNRVAHAEKATMDSCQRYFRFKLIVTIEHLAVFVSIVAWLLAKGMP